MDASGAAGFGVQGGDAAILGGRDGAAGGDVGVLPDDGCAEGFGGGGGLRIGFVIADQGGHEPLDASAVEVDVEAGEGEEVSVEGVGDGLGRGAERVAGKDAGEVAVIERAGTADAPEGGRVGDGNGEEGAVHEVRVKCGDDVEDGLDAFVLVAMDACGDEEGFAGISAADGDDGELDVRAGDREGHASGLAGRGAVPGEGGGRDHGNEQYNGLRRLSTVGKLNTMKLHGAIPPIGTPLLDGDRVDEKGLRKLNRYLLGAGVHGIFANGSMSGFAFLTEDEQVRSVAVTVAEVNRAVPVMGGVGETSTSRAVGLARRIAAEGVDAISLLPPFYFLANQDHLIAFFSDVAAAVDVPVYLYDNPVLTKNVIQPATVVKLRERIPHLRGIKVSNADYANLQTLIELFRKDDDFAVLTGHEFLILVGLQMGCDGFIGGIHNICPHIAAGLYEAFRRGDIEKARQLQQDLIATWQIFRHGAIWGAFDEALRYLEICERATGAPYVTALQEEERAAVRGILDEYVRPYLTVAAGR